MMAQILDDVKEGGKALGAKALDSLVIGGPRLHERGLAYQAAKRDLDRLLDEQDRFSRVGWHLLHLFKYTDEYMAYYADRPDQRPAFADPAHPQSFLTLCGIREFSLAGQALDESLAEKGAFPRQKRALRARMGRFEDIYILGEAPKWPRTAREQDTMRKAMHQLYDGADAIMDGYRDSAAALLQPYVAARYRLVRQGAVSALATGMLLYGAVGAGRALARLGRVKGVGPLASRGIKTLWG